MKTNRIYQLVAVLGFVLGLAIFGATGAAAVGVGKTCGGFPGIQCDAGLWCENKAKTCGIIDMQGKCIRVPQVCNKGIKYVCGCDNKTYTNDCERRMARVQKFADGRCK